MKFLVVVRDDLSGWIEAKALRNANSKEVARFLWEDVICRHGCFGRMIVDGGLENKDLVEDLAARYGIKRVLVSYHPQANTMVERGHKPVVDALAKMTDGGLGNWVQNLAAVLWADRSTVKSTTGLSPYYVLCGSEPVLPIELEIPTWRILPWNEVHTTEELLAMRARQIQRRDEDLEEAILHLQRRRMDGKEDFDDTHQIRVAELEKGDLILLHDTKRDAVMSTAVKLAYRWLGPYRIHEAIP